MNRLLIIFFIFLGKFTFAQELQCKVNLNFSQMSVNTSGDRDIFPEIERVISDFMNNQKWTNDVYAAHERIKCNLNINLLKSNGEYEYSGTAQFQVVRPVYGTTYETVLFNYVDRSFNFSYAPENRQMMFNEQSFTNNLTSILAFYSLTALTLDYDSFAKEGGSAFIDRMFNIVNLAGLAVGGPWDSKADIRERYWIMENLRNQQFSIYRNGFYNYHRLGLDLLTQKPESARKTILTYLEDLKNLNTLRPNTTLLPNFFDVKSEEIVNVFSEGSKKEKEAVYKLVVGIAPDKTEIFRRLLQ